MVTQLQSKNCKRERERGKRLVGYRYEMGEEGEEEDSWYLK